MSPLSPEDLSALSPEYLDETNNPERLEGVSILFITLSTIVFSLFVVSRAFCAPRNTWETWALYPVAYIATLSNCIICLLLELITGTGRRTAYLLLFAPDKLTLYEKLRTAVEFTYVLGTTLPKIAILSSYIRLFSDRKVKLLSWITIAVIILQILVFGFIVYFTICRPFSYQWDHIPNILTDLAIIGLPLPTLFRLQMGKAEKIGVVVTFLTGGLGLITAIIRFVEFYTADLASDRVFYSVDTFLWTVIEQGAYFICSCFPGTRALVITVHGKLRRGITRPSQAKSEVNSNHGSHKPNVSQETVSISSAT
ncbi:hypothetical protein F5B22DRAFT_636968 [Xylaria bambusicola]|uniref:uncharacterized protein n=1 Tax=Xylaria bambusicola TaxID=326684 RepID=UPI002007DFCA|nr:uncharacterized protein F5B22DRAFT_636968 [Xylaria bambusicola]KAI0514640.1 hypothetical protein F5B22DRAFT_636968 [Xylaria bambusicola]